MNPLSGVLGEAWTLYKRHAAHFLLISFTIYLVIGVITALLSLALGSFGAVIGGLLSLLGTFLLTAALVKIVPEIVVGGAGAFESFGRSWATVRGHAWRVFGTYVVVFVIMIVGQYVVQLILFALPSSARNSISDFVVGTLFAPFLAAVVTLVYDRLKLAHGQQPEPGVAPGGGYGSTTAPN